MQVACQLCELGPCHKFLTFLLLSEKLLVVIIQNLPDLLILGLNMMEVLLSSEKIMLVLSAVVAAIAKMGYRIEGYNFWMIFTCSLKNRICRSRFLFKIAAL